MTHPVYSRLWSWVMVRFECDYCQRLKEPGDNWIFGFAAELVGVTAQRREVSIASAWDDARAVDTLAVHFCSDRCMRKYMGELFGEEPRTTEIIEEVDVVPRKNITEKRIVRTIPGAKVETAVKRTTTRVKKTRRKAS